MTLQTIDMIRLRKVGAAYCRAMESRNLTQSVRALLAGNWTELERLNGERERIKADRARLNGPVYAGE